MTRLLGSRVDGDGVSFCVWAPDAQRVDVVLDDAGAAPLRMDKDGGGYFRAHSTAAHAGSRYRYRLDGGDAHADPYSRFQPDGPFGPSMVVDPSSFRWTDAGWRGLDASRQVVYELHIGTFTPEGTYRATERELGALKELGITSIEILPVNEFVGRFGWGYDGVNLFAPFHHYGEPDDLRHFVDRAHAAGLGVILDVVYNHFGSYGNYLPRFAAEYLDEETPNPWGGAPNYACEAMRRLCIDNAAYWIREFHMDGLRLDATQNIHDPRHPTLLASLVREARHAAGPRSIVISGEDYLQRTELLQGAGLDQLWNDDFHHAARVALTGNHAGYFKDYRGRSQEILSTLRHGYLYQGQYFGWADKPRGSPVKEEPLHSFVAFTQNHDQVANTLYGRRLDRLTSAPKARAMASVLLLGPHTPLLFMGQEFDSSAAFAYFADFEGEVGASLWESRKKEIQGFEEYADPAAQGSVLDPCDIETVRASTLDFAERTKNASTYQLYKDLIALRQQDPVLDERPQARVDGATLNEQAFLLRWYGAKGERLLLVNLGAQIGRHAIPEPLLAEPSGRHWRLIFSTNHPRYGGMGTILPVTEKGWALDAESAVFLAAG